MHTKRITRSVEVGISLMSHKNTINATNTTISHTVPTQPLSREGLIRGFIRVCYGRFSSCCTTIGNISSVTAVAKVTKLHISSPFFFFLALFKEPFNSTVDLSCFFVV